MRGGSQDAECGGEGELETAAEGEGGYAGDGGDGEAGEGGEGVAEGVEEGGCSVAPAPGGGLLVGGGRKGGGGGGGGGGRYSEGFMDRRSFKSAPAQKHSSSSLASIRTRVPAPMGPAPSPWPFLLATRARSSTSPSRLNASISALSSRSNCRDMALRLEGLLRLRMRTWPMWGAGIVWDFRRVGVGGLEEEDQRRRVRLKLDGRRGLGGKVKRRVGWR